MPESAKRIHTVIPAQLSFLAIYNPSLGKTDETFQDQVVYYYTSNANKARRRKNPGESSADVSHEEQNERLRQIGLAQGMVEFAKAFSDGEAVDAIESEKSRILLHELETGWWIIASIDLTRLGSFSDVGSTAATADKRESNIEYSAREVCPQSLLLQLLLRAHSIFLLHHAPTLAELYGRLQRTRFCGALEGFWSRFVRDWDVLLHGNPAIDIYNGLKLAAGGELGIGVGEEEWGSGEREVLEGFIGRTDGLVDMIVSRFGDGPKEYDGASKALLQTTSVSTDVAEPWLGNMETPRSSDGVIFSGIGAISRQSIKGVSAWVEWLYKYGQNTYGVENNPQSSHRKKRRKISPPAVSSSPFNDTVEETAHANITPLASHLNPSPESIPNIPPPIVTATNQSSGNLSPKTRLAGDISIPQSATISSASDDSSATGTETLMKYLTLGVYGSSWGIPIKRPEPHPNTSNFGQQAIGDTDEKGAPSANKPLRHPKPKLAKSGRAKRNGTSQDPSKGRFMIGLQGDLDDEDFSDDECIGAETGTDQESGLQRDEWNRRTSLRTFYVQRVRPNDEDHSGSFKTTSTAQVSDGFDRLRVVVYVRQPFIFTFLFALHTDSLTLPSFYRSLHHQLGPLLLPLLSSTSPLKVASLLYNATSPTTTTTSVTSTNSSQPIYDLVYDPSNLTIHTTIPSIPESGPAIAEDPAPSEVPWSRIEALNVHSQILNTYISTRRHTSELERTCKTNRGWWVVWMRLPQSESQADSDSIGAFREAILVRKASDYLPPTVRKASSMFRRDTSGSGWGAGKLAEGIGIDARRYIEGLLSLNR